MVEKAQLIFNLGSPVSICVQTIQVSVLMLVFMACSLALARPILARHQNHLLGSRREVGSASSMARAFVMADRGGYITRASYGSRLTWRITLRYLIGSSTHNPGEPAMSGFHWLLVEAAAHVMLLVLFYVVKGH